MTETAKNDLPLSIGNYIFTQDRGSARINVSTGAAVVNVTGQEYPVNYDHEKRRFAEVSLHEAVRQSPLAKQGFYVELWNPVYNDDGALKTPNQGKENVTPDLNMGNRINIPGPITFSLWPQQHARVIEGHRLRSNQYLEIQIYDEEAAKENWSKALIKTADGGEDKEDHQTFSDINPQDFTVGKKFVIRGTDVSFFIPPTGVEVLAEDKDDDKDDDNFVRDALTLENIFYCILVDENGDKRYELGPKIVFPRPTEHFYEAWNKKTKRNEKAFKGTELNRVSGVYIKVIADYVEPDGTERKKGDELFITGRDTTIYFPRKEHSIVTYEGNSKHFATAIPIGEARYVMDRENAKVRMAKGAEMLLADPRKEVILRRVLTEKQCALWYPGNAAAQEYNRLLRDIEDKTPSTRAGVTDKEFKRRYSRGRKRETEVKSGGLIGSEDANLTLQAMSMISADESDVHSDRTGAVADEWERASTYQQPRTLTLNTRFSGVPTICPWQNNAVQIVNRSGERHVIVGPETAMLEYDEDLEVLALSTGKPKTTDRIERTVYLRTRNNGVTDIIDDVETKDHVTCEVKLRYLVQFEGDAVEERNKWFEVENYVKLLCDHARSILKNTVKKLTVRDFHADAADIIRERILGDRADDGRPGMFFPENNMRVTEVEVLSCRIGDQAILQLLDEQQHHVVSSDIALQKARKALEVPLEMPDDEWITDQLRDLASLFREDERRAAVLLRQLLGRVEAHQVIAPGKKRGYSQLHFRINGWEALLCVLDDRIPAGVLEAMISRDDETGVSEKFHGGKIDFRIEFEPFHHQLAMLFSDLMREDFIHAVVGPFEILFGVVPCVDSQPDSGMQQCLRVGLHAGTIVSVFFHFDSSCTQLVAGSIRSKRSAEQPVSGSAQFFVTQNNGRGTGTDGQRRKLTFHVLTSQGRRVEQRVDGSLDQRAADFGAHDNPRTDAAQFDHVGNHRHTVEQAQTGVTDIQRQSRAGQPGGIMDLAGGGRFHLIATDRTVNQRTEITFVNPGGLDGFGGRQRADFPGLRPRVEEPSLADARHQFQPAGRESETFVDRRKLCFDFSGRDDVRRQGVAECCNRNVLIPHANFRTSQLRSHGPQPVGFVACQS
ncbi:MAG: hypothetical protein IH899_01960 [Planctomycetes bacterium]|nr:hypothetical protein [Planctomycetota bacterium]